MNKINIYKFWFGDNQNEIENKIKEFNNNSKFINIILAPTKEEHDFLIKDNDFYKKYFEEKKYVFLSDIYRVWKAANTKNFVYLDYSIEFNEKKLFNLITNSINENKNIFVFESYSIVWSGFFVSNNLSSVFEKCYKESKDKQILSGPILITKYLKKEKLIKNYKKYSNLLTCFDISFLNFKNEEFEIIRINPSASWRKKDVSVIWEKKYKNFNKTKLRDAVFLKIPYFLQKIVFKMIN